MRNRPYPVLKCSTGPSVLSRYKGPARPLTQSEHMLSLGLIAASSGTEIHYNEYSASPTIGNGNGESDGPASEFGAMAIFIDRVRTLTRKLDGEQEVCFKPDQGTPCSLNALRPGVQFSNGESFSEPSWGFLYNSMPFAMSFSDMLLFLHKKDGMGPTGAAREFAIVYKAMHKVAGIPVAPGDLGPFPGESCALESSSAS